MEAINLNEFSFSSSIIEASFRTPCAFVSLDRLWNFDIIYRPGKWKSGSRYQQLLCSFKASSVFCPYLKHVDPIIDENCIAGLVGQKERGFIAYEFRIGISLIPLTNSKTIKAFTHLLFRNILSDAASSRFTQGRHNNEAIKREPVI